MYKLNIGSFISYQRETFEKISNLNIFEKKMVAPAYSTYRSIKIYKRFLKLEEFKWEKKMYEISLMNISAFVSMNLNLKLCDLISILFYFWQQPTWISISFDFNFLEKLEIHEVLSGFQREKNTVDIQAQNFNLILTDTKSESHYEKYHTILSTTNPFKITKKVHYF